MLQETIRHVLDSHVGSQSAIGQGSPQAGKPSVTKISIDAIQRPPKP